MAKNPKFIKNLLTTASALAVAIGTTNAMAVGGLPAAAPANPVIFIEPQAGAPADSSLALGFLLEGGPATAGSISGDNIQNANAGGGANAAAIPGPYDLIKLDDADLLITGAFDPANTFDFFGYGGGIVGNAAALTTLGNVINTGPAVATDVGLGNVGVYLAAVRAASGFGAAAPGNEANANTRGYRFAGNQETRVTGDVSALGYFSFERFNQPLIFNLAQQNVGLISGNIDLANVVANDPDGFGSVVANENITFIRGFDNRPNQKVNDLTVAAAKQVNVQGDFVLVNQLEIRAGATTTIKPNAGVPLNPQGDAPVGVDVPTVVFGDAASKLVLATDGARNSVHVLTKTIAFQGQGKVELNANGFDLAVTANVAAPNPALVALGANNGAGRVTELIVSGANAVHVNVPTRAKKIIVQGNGIPGNPAAARDLVFLKIVDSGADGLLQLTGARNINFAENTTIGNVADAATGIDFNGQRSTIVVDNGKNLIANVNGNAADAAGAARNANANLVILGGEYTGTAKNIARMQMSLNGNSKFVTQNAAHTIAELGLAANVTTLPAGFKNTGVVVGNGNAIFEGNATFDGNVGTALAPAGNFRMDGANSVVNFTGTTNMGTLFFNAADQKFLAGGNFKGGLNFVGNNGLFKLTGDADTTVDFSAGVTNPANGKFDFSSILAGHTLTINNAFGTAAAKIKEVNATGGAKIVFTTAAGAAPANAGRYIEKLDIGAHDTTIVFDDQAANPLPVVGNLSNQAGKGILQINRDTIFGDANTAFTSSNQVNKLEFTADAWLTIGKQGLKLSPVNGITTTALNTGKLEFTGGDNVLNFTVATEANPLGRMILTDLVGVAPAAGAAPGAPNVFAKVTLLKKAYFRRDIELAINNTLEIQDDLTSSQVSGSGAANNEGIFILNNKKSSGVLTYNGRVGGIPGANEALQAVRISGGDAAVAQFAAGQDATQRVEFTNANTPATFTIKDILGGVLNTTVTSAGNGIHKLVLGTAPAAGAPAPAPVGLVTLQGSYGTAANRVGITVDSANVAVDAPVFADLATTADNTYSISFLRPTTGINTAGSAANAYTTATFTPAATGTQLGDLYTRQAAIQAGTTVAFKGTLSSATGDAGQTTLAGVGAGAAVLQLGTVPAAPVAGAAPVADNTLAILDHNVNGVAAGQGVVEIVGNTSILKAIGNTSPVQVFRVVGVNPKKIDLGANISAEGVNLGAGNTYNLKATAEITANPNGIVSDNNTLKIAGGNTLALSGATTLQNTTTVNTSYDAVSNSFGKVVVTNLAAAGTQIKIDIDDKGLVVGNTPVSYQVVQINALGAGVVPVTVAAGVNPRSLNTLALDAAQLGYIVATNNAKNVVNNNNALNNDQKAFLTPLVDPTTNTNDEARAEIQATYELSDEKAKEFIGRYGSQTTSAVTAELANQNAEVFSVLGSRIASVTAPEVKTVSVGQAAGDDVTRSGAWVMGFYGQGAQKAKNGVAGYKSKYAGAVVGADTMVNDSLTLGVAVTLSRSDMKHKDVLAGGKTKANTAMFSLYGLQSFAGDWFAQGIVSFGSSKVTTRSKQLVGANYQTGTGKYDVLSYGAEVLTGYNYKMSQDVVLTPMLGLSYTRFNDSGYKETGLGALNRTVSKRATDKFEAILGARVATNTQMNGMEVTPEAHAFVRQSLGNKAPKVDVRMDGLANPLAVKKGKVSNTLVNLGFGVNAKSGAMEYGVGYDATLGSKYMGHQGTLKVRVNF